MSWGFQEILIAFFAGQSLVLFWMFRDQQAMGRLLKQQVIDQGTRRRLASQLLESHRREQRRMSSELHDGVGQNLAGIALLVGSFAPQLQSASADAANKLERISNLLESTRQQAEERVIDPKVGPELGLERGLAKALEGLAANIEAIFCLRCSVSGEVPRLDPLTAGHLFRLAEEAVYNAIRHAEPSHLRLLLSYESTEACLCIEDDGHGFRGEPDPRGRGLHLMSLRSRRIGGTLETGPRETGGSRVACHWPLDLEGSP